MYCDEEQGFDFSFEPIEDTLSIAETESGYEAKYLCRDDNFDSPDEWGDDEVFIVNYHRDFWVERNNIISKETVKEIYRNEKSEERTEIEKSYHIFALSCLIHSGVWLSLGDSFMADPGGWDTSHVGLVLVSQKETRFKKKAAQLAQGLIETWNMCLTGDVYGIVKETYDEQKEQVDIESVWGFYGYKYAVESLKIF